jgi:hypothetical protein
MSRSTKLEDLPVEEQEQEEEQECEELEEPRVVRTKKTVSVTNEMQVFLMSNLKEILSVIIIIAGVNMKQVSELFSKIPLPKSEFTDPVVKGVVGGLVYFLIKFYLV